MITPDLIINILLILTVAWVLGSLFSRFGLPVMLGELAAGVLLGPPLLGLVTESPSLDILAEWGIFFVMFYTGMEMDPKELLEHIWPSLAVALGGFVLPFVSGSLSTMLFGGTLYQSLFVGMGVSITAIAVQSVILQQLRIHRTPIGHIIIGAAIADDILALISLSVLLGLAKTGSVSVINLSIIVAEVSAFFGLTIVLGHYVVPKFTRKLHDREGKAFTFAIASALIMGFLAESVGLHLIMGAFLAGQFVRKEIMDANLYHTISDRFFGISYGFLVPVFFASLSFHLQVNWHPSFIAFAFVLILVAIACKLVGSGLGLSFFRPNRWEMAIVGFGMNGRGAVELVVVSVVLALSKELMASGKIVDPLLTQDQFSALVLMAFVTTLMAPICLRWTVKRGCLPDEREAVCRLLDGA